tara:strand:- start:186 stop:863 length:678 start_codon:yes stop_codon:yes gene_type:complete
MGFINKTSAVTVKARMTAQGTKYLLTDPQRFNITQFALSDDEVDYSLYNEAHVNGTDFFGDVIENMPVLEATSNSHHQMKYFLLSGVNPGTIRRPGLLFSPQSITLEYADSAEPLRITLINADEGNARIRYKILDTAVCDLTVQGGNHTMDDISGLAHPTAFNAKSTFVEPKQGHFDLSSAVLTVVPKRWDQTHDGTTVIEFEHHGSGAISQIAITTKKNNEFSD